MVVIGQIANRGIIGTLLSHNVHLLSHNVLKRKVVMVRCRCYPPAPVVWHDRLRDSWFFKRNYISKKRAAHAPA
jgi:hypothetical protein